MNAVELRDITISWLTISLAFAIIFSNGVQNIQLDLIAVSLITVGAGFILHELAHKYSAIHYGAHAEFRMWPLGLVIALVTSFFNFVFAAPGAVYIFGNLSRKRNGIISLAGPLTNIALAGVFFAVLALNPSGFLGMVGAIGMQVNLFLAVFNLLPLFPLDGSKVFYWSPIAWAVAFFVPLIALISIGFF
ncbi:MAG: site-2 protease family protein [Candidatus Diapherotrites archaeon]